MKSIRSLLEIYKPMCIHSQRRHVKNTRKLLHYMGIRKRQFSTFDSLAAQGPITLLSEEDIFVRDTATCFAWQEVRPRIQEIETNGVVPKYLLEAILKNKLLTGRHYTDPNREGSLRHSVLVLEQFGKVDLGLALMLQMHNNTANWIEKFNKPSTRSNIQPAESPIKKLYSTCVGTSSIASDTYSLTTKAKQDSDSFILNGKDMWISNVKNIGSFLVFAEQESFGNDTPNITGFLIDQKTPGVQLEKSDDSASLRSLSVCPLVLDNCKIPMHCVVGMVDEGYHDILDMLIKSRIGVAAALLGLSTACLEYTVPYLMDHQDDTSHPWQQQMVEHTLSSMCTLLEAGRTLVYNTARLYDAGLNPMKEASMSKYFTSELASTITKKCNEYMQDVEVHGDYWVNKYYTDCQAAKIFESSGDIQLNTISKHILSEFKH